MHLAVSIRRRSTCPRAPSGGVGCVLVDGDRHVVGTGYVGSLRGQAHCTEVGCMIDQQTGGCVRTVHAEQNAILHSLGLVRQHMELASATAYVTLSPCWACFKLLVQAGVGRIVYAEEYRTGVGLQLEHATYCGVRFEQYRTPTGGVLSIPHDNEGPIGQ